MILISKLKLVMHDRSDKRRTFSMILLVCRISRSDITKPTAASIRQ